MSVQSDDAIKGIVSIIAFLILCVGFITMCVGLWTYGEWLYGVLT